MPGHSELAFESAIEVGLTPAGGYQALAIQSTLHVLRYGFKCYGKTLLTNAGLAAIMPEEVTP